MGKRFQVEGGVRPPRQEGADVDGICAGLARSGLDCSENDRDAVQGHVAEVTSAFAREGVEHVVARPEAKAGPHEYQVDNSNRSFHEMKFLLENLHEIKQHDIYYVAHHRVEDSFSSSTIGAIKEAFTQAGQVISQVQGGFINPEQVAGLMGQVLATLAETQKQDFHQEDTDMLFLVDRGAVHEADRIAGVKYSYDLTVKDTEEKGKTTHHAHYQVEQWNIVFTDADEFDEVVTKTRKVSERREDRRDDKRKHDKR